MPPLPPETQILERAKAIIEALDLKTLFALKTEPTVRHFRNRTAAKSERPGIALRFGGTEINNERGPYHTSSEVCRAMTVDIVVDLSLLPERDDGVASVDNDVTGWDRLLGVGHYVAGQLVRMDSDMRGLVDDLLYGDVDPDEDSNPDEGRLDASVIVLYRTLFDDPMMLLAPEENA